MDPRTHAQALAKLHLEQGDPTGWFDALYTQAQGDAQRIPWADLKPNHNLISWLDRRTELDRPRALTVGCGLGDDAEELASRGREVTAFDISPTAIDWCLRRFPESKVHYQVADLLNPPPLWTGRFDFIYECYTLQVLPTELRTKAASNLIQFLAPGGTLLLICRGREETDYTGNMPWPLTKSELKLLMAGVNEAAFEDFMDGEQPPVRRFRVEYRSADSRF